MANIGSFKKSGNEYQGEIVTLSVQTKGVRIVPEANRSNDNAPSHRVFVGRAEIGAAWSKRSTEGRDYLSLNLDDPSFNAPIIANLIDDGGTGGPRGRDVATWRQRTYLNAAGWEGMAAARSRPSVGAGQGVFA